MEKEEIPMSYEQLLEMTLAYLRKLLNDPELEITPRSSLMDDLALSSMEMLQALVHLESCLELRIPEKALRRILTVEDVVKVVWEQRGKHAL